MKSTLYIYLSLMVMFSFGLISCNQEDLLEKSPVSGLNGNSYNSESNLEAAAYAMYDVLQWQSINGQHVFPLLFQGIRADDLHSQFANFWAAGLVMDDLSLVNADNINVQLLWQKWYSGVNRANLVIERSQQFTGWRTQEAQDQLVAEGKSMRAFFYFELLRMFGGVPLILSPIESTNDLPPLGRASEAEVYAQIDQDLTESIEHLPLKSASVIGRATKGMAQALLAKSKLYQADYDAVIQYSEAVINSGEYQLEPVFANNFTSNPANENGVESILEIQYEDGFTSAYFEQANQAAQGSASWQMMFAWVSGRFTSFSNMLPRGDLKDLYDANLDQRYEATFMTVGTDINAVSPRLAENWGLNECCGGILDASRMSQLRPDLNDCNYAMKYFISWELVDQLLQPSQSPKNENIIRYAEVLLMHAEARAMGGAGGSLDGQTSLNQVTERAGIGTLSLNIENVKLERRRELATEGWNRFSDLVRWGDAPTALAFKGFKVGRDEKLPIPQAEIDAVGASILQQNEGY